jgi:hypothetical protein
MERLLRHLFVFGSAAFFAVMWGLLLRSHLPALSQPSVRLDYAKLLKPGEKERSLQWAVWFRGQRIGTCTMKIQRQEPGTFLVCTNTDLSVQPLVATLLGIPATLDIAFRASLSPLRGLQYFNAQCKSLNIQIQGTVIKGQILLTGSMGDETIRQRIPFDESRLLGQTLSPLAGLPELDESSIGATWTVELVNPLTASMQEVTISVSRARKVVLPTGEITAFQLLFTVGNARWWSWVTGEGDVLVQGTPLGLTLRRADLPAAAFEEPEPAQARPTDPPAGEP